jgi:D-aminoacyl-tRNA deacylase
MRVLIQRVSEARVVIDREPYAAIGTGLLILVGIEQTDQMNDVEWLAQKIALMRLFSDKQGLMNLSVNEVQGEVLVVSQFTLHAETRKGNRPGFGKAARPDLAKPMYLAFCDALSAGILRPVKTGIFGADMKIHLCNDGPVTIWMDSKNRE